MRNLVPAKDSELKSLFQGLQIIPSYKWNRIKGITLKQADTELEVSVGRGQDDCLELHIVEEGTFEDRWVLTAKNGVSIPCNTKDIAEELAAKLEELGILKDSAITLKRVKVGK